MKLKLLMLAGLIACGFAMSASAGTITDTDSDGVPNTFDNCTAVANNAGGGGTIPGTCTQLDNFDGDAYGDACDADYNQDNLVTGGDFAPWFAAFTAGVPIAGEDADCDGLVTGGDFAPWFAQFTAGTPGPGL